MDIKYKICNICKVKYSQKYLVDETNLCLDSIFAVEFVGVEICSNVYSLVVNPFL